MPISDSQRLIPLSEALALLLAGRGLLEPVDLPLAQAAGCVLAKSLSLSASLPPQAVAQRDGIAVASADLVGASSYAPAFLATAPLAVRSGEALPEGCDAVVPADAASRVGAMTALGQAAYPGENVTLAGADLTAGTVIARAGERLDATRLMALELAGFTQVAVRRPRILLRGGGDAPGERWLRAMLGGVGILLVADGESDLAVETQAGERAAIGIALRPAVPMLPADADHPACLVLPKRFDGIVAAFHAVLLPLLAHLTGQTLPETTRPLTRKIASLVGFSEIALLRADGDGYMPLAVGQVTLAALLAADAVAVIAPDSEGAPAGARLSATPISTMTRPP